MRPNCTISPAQLYEDFFGPAVFRPLANALIDFAPPPRGGKVIDLACGTGIVARALAPLLGTQGEVLAVDVNPGMLAIGRASPPPAGAPVSWMQADASTVVFPPQKFDAVYCQQGLQFFPDRAAALRAVRNALKPGGFLVLAVWKGIEHHPLFRAFAEVEARHLHDMDVTYEDAIASFSLGDADTIRSLLLGAGFTEPRVTEHVVQAVFTDPPAFARSMETAYGAVIPRFLEDRDAFEAFVRAVEEETRDMIARFTEGGAVRFGMPTNLFLATTV